MNEYLDINVPELRPDTIVNDGDIQTALEVILFGPEVLREGILRVYGDEFDVIVGHLWNELGDTDAITAEDVATALSGLYELYKDPIDYVLNTYLKHERHEGNTNKSNFIAEVLTVIEDIMEERAYEIWEDSWGETEAGNTDWD
jgi:hypothetical protein